MFNNIQHFTNRIQPIVQWFKTIPNRFVVVALASIALVTIAFFAIRYCIPQSMRNSFSTNAHPGFTPTAIPVPLNGDSSPSDSLSLLLSDSRNGSGFSASESPFRSATFPSSKTELVSDQLSDKEMSLREGMASYELLQNPAQVINPTHQFSQQVVIVEGEQQLHARVCSDAVPTIEEATPGDNQEGWLRPMPERCSNPVDIHQDQGSYPFDVHFASTIGARDEMEDTHIAAILRNGARVVGVFDGHGGNNVSEFLHVHTVEFLENEFQKMEERESLSDEELQARCILALHNAFIELDVATMEIGMSEGSTAIVALVVGQKLIVANLGDSRAILLRNGRPIPLTVDAECNHERYSRQVTALGGFVERGRVGGSFGLGTPAAIGDHRFVSSSKSGKYIINIPEISMFDYREGDRVVIACDGLWDALSSNHVAQRLGERTADNVPEEITDAALLVRLAVLTPRQYDNVSVGIINL